MKEAPQPEETFRLIVEAAPNAIVVIDEDGRIVIVNSQTEKLFGYSREELIDKNVELLVPDRFRHSHPGLRGGFFVEPRARPMGAGRDLFGLRKDGSEFPVEIGLNPLRTERGMLVLSAIADITERKKLERELHLRLEDLAAADRQKDEFLAMLAHELRNPLAPMRNALQILNMPTAQARVQQRAREMMARQLQHLVRLVDDLLDVSRIITGRVELRKERFDLQTAISRAVETAEPLIDARGHRLIVSVPEVPIPACADLVRISQIIANLLTNAAKYTPRPGRIWVTAEQDGSEAVVRVKDEGMGIAPDMLNRVFDLFVQADASPSRTQGGLGIGLTLVKRLIELHDGTVTAESKGLGQGSEFVLRFPLDTAATAHLADAPASYPSRTHDGACRVLIVDDNVDAAESIAMLLEASGFSVSCVFDGLSALSAASAYRPNVIVLDIGLPDITGYEVAKRLRAMPDFASTPIVAVTGYGQQDDRRRSQEAGIDHHMTKPVDPDALRSVLTSSMSSFGRGAPPLS